MIYTKIFNNQTEFNTYKNSSLYVKPNISYFQDNLNTKYLPYIKYITAAYNITSIENPTKIVNDPAVFSEVIIDGSLVQLTDASVQFNSLGEHIIKYIKINDTSLYVDSSCFYNNKNLKSITLASNIKTIKDNSFYGCNNLENIYIPEGVTIIGLSALRECTKLRRVTIPEGVTSTGGWCFRLNPNLRYVNIPSTMTTLALSTFLCVI